MQDPRTSRTTPAGPPGPRAEGSDADLVAALRTRDSDEEDHATALLLTRHWQALLDYAEIRSPSANAASMLATAAFGKVLDTLRRPGPVPALRPEFLLTARHLAGIWAAEGQQAAEGHPTGTVWEHPARPHGHRPGEPRHAAPSGESAPRLPRLPGNARGRAMSPVAYGRRGGAHIRTGRSARH